ncbi:MFS general substrate transporter [Lepidopterella palustris CBS 459.81]|uniref:MFS general substrate transporter n=1 Tax=Lepidopterella palustris CBS 459.81 TaxID=1314670 RepID=A0A8E2E9V5_9PEZI|nr:MFS general substrate transporter [Lepidopterella palustris CBS 459.81]
MASESDPNSKESSLMPSRVDVPEAQLQAASNEELDSQEKEHVYIADSLSLPRQFLFVATICMSMFTLQVGLGQTLDILHVIGDSYGITNPGVLSWLVAGYSLTIGTFILISGRFGDDFGHKKMFVIGTCWYALWSLIAGLAVYSNYVLFVFARVFQGMGPAMTLPNGLAILGQSYSPGPNKNMAFAAFASMAPLGSITGFAAAGLFALAWWPWAFWSSAIALSCLAVFSAWVIPAQPVNMEAQKRTLRETINHLDLPGCLTGVTALVLFNFAWNQATVVGWEKAYVYICLILGVLFGVVFFLIELFWASAPILPLAAFTSDIAFVLACTACGWACFGIWVFYAANLVVTLDGISPLLLAAYYSPVVPSGMLAAFAVGKLLGRISPAWVMLIGMLAYTLGSILVATMPVGQIYWSQFFFSTLIICVGMDSSFPAATLIFSNAVRREYQGIGASVVATVVNYSISLGLGFAGTVERQVNRGGRTGEDKLKGYRGAFYVAVGLAGLGFLLSVVFVGKGYLGERRNKKGIEKEGVEEKEVKGDLIRINASYHNVANQSNQSIEGLT